MTRKCNMRCEMFDNLPRMSRQVATTREILTGSSQNSELSFGISRCLVKKSGYLCVHLKRNIHKMLQTLLELTDGVTAFFLAGRLMRIEKMPASFFVTMNSAILRPNKVRSWCVHVGYCRDLG